MVQRGQKLTAVFKIPKSALYETSLQACRQTRIIFSFPGVHPSLPSLLPAHVRRNQPYDNLDQAGQILVHTRDVCKLGQCTMGLSPCKMGNREFVSYYHHRPHFLEIQLFQTEIFGDCQLRSFTFELYLGSS